MLAIRKAIGRKISYNCPKSQINYISRVPTYIKLYGEINNCKLPKH